MHTLSFASRMTPVCSCIKGSETLTASLTVSVMLALIG